MKDNMASDCKYFRDISNRTSKSIALIDSRQWININKEYFRNFFITYRNYYISPVIKFEDHYTIAIYRRAPQFMISNQYTTLQSPQTIIQQALDFIDTKNSYESSEPVDSIQERDIKAEPNVIYCGDGVYKSEINMRYCNKNCEWSVVSLAFKKYYNDYTHFVDAKNAAKKQAPEYLAYFKKLYSTNRVAFDLVFNEHDSFTIHAIERYPERVLENKHPYDNAEARKSLKAMLVNLIDVVVDTMSDDIVEKAMPIADVYLKKLDDNCEDKFDYEEIKDNPNF
jgi:hypothetical protein